MTICINNFTINGNTEHYFNALREDKIDDLLGEIDRLCGGNIPQKFKYLFRCLSQTLASKGLSNTQSGICESVLKDRIYQLAKNNSLEAIDTISMSIFKYDSNLNEIIEKVNYLAKPKFFSKIKKGIVFNTRCSHHIDKLYGKIDSTTATRAMTYLIPAVTFITTAGLVQLYSADGEISKRNITVAAPAFCVGSSFLIFPFVHILRATCGENP